jgi:hypothetical protein
MSFSVCEAVTIHRAPHSSPPSIVSNAEVLMAGLSQSAGNLAKDVAHRQVHGGDEGRQAPRQPSPLTTARIKPCLRPIIAK